MTAYVSSPPTTTKIPPVIESVNHMSVWISCAGVDAGAVVLGVASGPLVAIHRRATGKETDAKVQPRARFEMTERIECIDRASRSTAAEKAAAEPTKKLQMRFASYVAAWIHGEPGSCSFFGG